MGLFNGFLSHPAEVSLKQISLEYGFILIDDEYVEKAYKVNRDKFILTNKRLLLITYGKGNKLEYMTIPYSSIRKFSKEGMDAMDKDSELRIWLKDEALPIKKEFKDCEGVNEIYQILSRYTL
ncbi:PH domain-containing protein [Pedobacter sp. P351]|uniref:PH domain-containing protein n=1 Tax=Pedobacter superstes TaxID=3133441 RepID=UPI0030B3CCEA